MFTQNALDYNLKLIVYSMVVSFAPVAKKLMKYNRRLDPLNESKLWNGLIFLYCFCLLYPLAIVWDLYEAFTPLKVVLLIY